MNIEMNIEILINKTKSKELNECGPLNFIKD